MAQSIVDPLKVIQIDKQNAYLFAIAISFFDRFFQAVAHQQAIGQLGKVIVIRLLQQSLLIFTPQGDVFHHSDKMGNFTCLVRNR